MPKVGRPKDVDLIESLKEDLKKAPRPKMSRISSHFIKECGGEANFAKFLHADYIAAGEGSAIRQRIMALIATLSKNDDEGFDSTAFDDMDADDLKRVAAMIQKEVNEIRSKLDGDSEDEADAEGEASEPRAEADRPGEGGDREED